MTSSRHRHPVTDRTQTQAVHIVSAAAAFHRWECACQTPGVLLATWSDDGRVNIKVRDRYWHVSGGGVIETVCPRCATEHRLALDDLSGDPWLPSTD